MINDETKNTQKAPEWLEKWQTVDTPPEEAGDTRPADLEEADGESKGQQADQQAPSAPLIIKLGTKTPEESATYLYTSEKKNGEKVVFHFRIDDIKRALKHLNIATSGTFYIEKADAELVEVIALQIQKDRAEEYLQEHADELPQWAKNNKEIQALAPFLLNELYYYKLGEFVFSEDEKHAQATRDLSLLSILKEGYTTKGQVKRKGNEWKIVIEAAKEAQEEAENLTQKPQQITYNPPISEKMLFPVDDLAFRLFSPGKETPIPVDGQQRIVPLADAKKNCYELNYGKDSNPAFLRYYFWARSATPGKLLQDMEQITFAEDYFITAVADDLFYSGNSIITPRKFTEILHGKTNPGSVEIDRVYKRILALSSIDFWGDLSNLNENYNAESSALADQPIIKSSVLPVQIYPLPVEVNGAPCTQAIQILGFSPFYLVGHFTNRLRLYSREVLSQKNFPKEHRRSKNHYAVLMYMLKEISRLNQHNQTTLNLASIYRAVADKHFERTLETLKSVLDYVLIPAEIVAYYEISGSLQGNGGQIDIYTPEVIKHRERQERAQQAAEVRAIEKKEKARKRKQAGKLRNSNQ